jgi:tetratricopeptide (TPR) repeat protein
MKDEPSIAAAAAAFQEGDLVRARRLAQERLANGEQAPRLYHLIGLIECRAGRVEDGVHWLRRASGAAPGDAAIARDLGSALSNVGRPGEARTALETAVALDPGNVRGRVGYARLLIDLGRQSDALAELDEGSRLAFERLLRDDREGANCGAAIGMSSDRLVEVRELGLLLDRMNRVDDLRRLLAAAEKAGIARETLGSLWASVALREGRLKEAKNLLLRDSAPFDDSHWDRLRTKVADALGDADEAFAAATAMNRAVPGYDEWRRRGAHYRAHIRMTARIVTPEWASRIQHSGANDDVPDPAFVVGFPRSGTTLLDTFLMGHPQTHVVEEGKMLELATGVISEADGVDWPAGLVARARQAYVDELSRHVPPGFNGLVVDKHPFNMLRLAVLHALFPGAKVIFAQRHPCDVVLSGYMQSFMLNHAMASFLDLGDAADLYDAAMTMWSRSREAVPQSIHTVVYERLTADPAAELRPALEFLGLDWSDQLLDHQSTAKARGLITTASYDQVVQPLSRAPSGRWRRYRRHLEPVLPVLLPWAERLGYAD